MLYRQAVLCKSLRCSDVFECFFLAKSAGGQPKVSSCDNSEYQETAQPFSLCEFIWLPVFALPALPLKAPRGNMHISGTLNYARRFHDLEAAVSWARVPAIISSGYIAAVFRMPATRHTSDLEMWLADSLLYI